MPTINTTEHNSAEDWLHRDGSETTMKLCCCLLLEFSYEKKNITLLFFISFHILKKEICNMKFKALKASKVSLPKGGLS